MLAVGMTLVIGSQLALASKLQSWNGTGVFRVHLDAGRHVVYLDLFDPLGEGANPDITVTGPRGSVKTILSSFPDWVESLALVAPLHATVATVTFTTPVGGTYEIRSPFSQGLPADAYTVDVGPPPTWFAAITYVGSLVTLVGLASLIFYPVWLRRRDPQSARSQEGSGTTEPQGAIASVLSVRILHSKEAAAGL